MSTEYTLEQQLDQVTEGFRQAEMARKYKEITEAQGPSQQLIDFINADGKLGEEIGLEGFETFSTGTQHEILLSKLNADAMEAVAMEGFRDFIKKYRKWLIVGSFLIPVGGFPLLAAGVAGVIINRNDNKVMQYTDFNREIDDLKKQISVIEKMISEMPSSNDKGKWNSFKLVVEANNDDFTGGVNDHTPMVFKKSGWNITNIMAELKGFENLSNKAEEVRKSFNEKLGKIENLEDVGTSSASAAVSELIKMFKKLSSKLGILKTEITKVSKCFEPKK